jgi:PTH2 family peptidyl-tRNA hydrolase
MYKQIIIARKDLGMSAGKLAAQVSHASMAFLTNMIRRNIFTKPAYHYDVYTTKEDGEWIKVGESEIDCYRTEFDIEKNLYEDWINGIFTKVVLQAKNRNQLMKAVEMAKELGWKEGVDYFLIKDCCKTELEPEEVDENGVGRTLTCIGFAPKPAEEIDKIAKKFHTFVGEVV